MRYCNYIILALLLLVGAGVNAQQVSNNELEHLQVKSGYMIASGVVFTVAGATLTGFGVSYYKLGIELNTTSGGYSSPYDYRPPGRAMISVGVPVMAGGLALLCAGIHFRTVYLDKKKKATITGGYLKNGTLGLAMNF